MNDTTKPAAVQPIPSMMFESPVRIIRTNYPEPVGYWVLYPGAPALTKFAIYSKPTEEQIKNTGELLGWGWEDAK
ncbi:hypothetical protein [Pseudoduganella sp. RAF53_2]|uniref:hypothetical protein n=1 Tax=unclassified Pseudoduganella TaxID=2637179 RepID=UPI003F9BEC81